MNDITKIPTHELKNDLFDSIADIKICTLALANGITSYSGGDIKYRLEQNKYFVDVITAELERRAAVELEKETK